MTIRNITVDQLEDRFEWLVGTAGRTLACELDRVRQGSETIQLIDELDRVKRAAEECAKYIRRHEAWTGGES